MSLKQTLGLLLGLILISSISLAYALSDAENLYNKGISLNDSGKFEEAIKIFDQAIKLNPKYTDAWNKKGVALIGLGKFEEAIKIFDQAIKIDPKHVKAWNNKGIALSELGEDIEAIKVLDQANKIDPKHANAWNTKGVVLEKLGKHEDAIKAFDQAIKMDPKEVKAWTNKGFSLFALGKYGEANKILDQAIKLTPNYSDAWVNKGSALVGLGKFEEAVKSYDQAIKIDPKDATALYLKGIVLDELGKHEDAIKAFDQAIKIDPKFEKLTKKLFSSSPPKTLINTYVDDVLGFQFNTPKNWFEGEPPENASISFYSESENSGIAISYKQQPKIPRATWNLMLGETKNQKEVEKLFTNTILQVFPTGYKISPLKFTYYFDGLKATWSVNYVIWIDGEKYQMRGNSVLWYLSETGDAYELDYFATTDEYKTYYPSFKTAVDTFYVYPTQFEDLN